MSAFVMRQCADDDCRMRYPVGPTDPPAARCPACGGATTVTDRFDGHAPVPPGGDVARRRLAVLLDNVRSLYNVGSIFRSADAAGLAHVYLCGYTATPDHPKLAKTALGAQHALAWSHHRHAPDLVRVLQAGGAQVWALEGGARAQSLFAARLPDDGTPVVLAVGNERAGVDPALLALCDRVVHIPLYGIKESLNVATAFGIAAYFLALQTAD